MSNDIHTSISMDMTPEQNIASTSTLKSAYTPDSALVVKQVSHSFTDSGCTIEVLQQISLEVKKGEFVSLIGPSGSGKSTLFHIIGGLLSPIHGSITIEGKQVTGETGHISYMPQSSSLLPWRTIEENVGLALEIEGVSRKETLKLAREWLPKVGLDGYEKAYPHMLSGGMQQRVAFLRALLSRQELICLDEPFGALDALSRTDMQNWLLSIWEKHKRSVLLITHSIDEAIFLSDKIYVLTAKPAQVAATISVPFERPRREKMLLSPEFLLVKKEILTLLRHSQQA
ncbi:ABC transporter ATP-binding protein [Brevibacillus laterosporus]|uniref:ABC transporter ATP-binding protein n=1 Tax=Brevibacillus laterosporus TaxID=1465 RepID=UPI0018CF0157|nr:ABC transporter ATP-binding protein [Brevibacillus laterosporus]MCR8935845.1 ABC transporter ATP-binding protein [Brevibacillus laterosporus]MCZ0838484.1 ABC transporter ATP-binding protein [Brevibacillus laterosporus]MCZ0844444.1 ABC transporter ATP-binding protein [Brevibacillus laterosporus]MED1910709.1 ABC transporter ATP-binding protein [Brevibacillus laterosporus]